MKEKIKTTKIQEIENAVNTILESYNFSLVDIELREGSDILVTLFIYNSVSTNIEDIGKINKIIYPILEKLSFLKEGFSLEVSSPGIYRNIKSSKEFNIFKGKEAKIILQDGSSIIGIINLFENENLHIINNKGEEIILNLDNINKASLNG